ncbi:DUF6571 family protein [Embleya sp. MST-111070]|uniref:DUF6571 family protein n=1 Tax=Embleya sp. MST-111070 TaxID=3398231 RepID=UPI003F73C47E
MNLAQFRQANLDGLSAAVAYWDALAGRMQGVELRLGTELSGPIKSGKWQGLSAKFAGLRIDTVHKQLTNATLESRAVASVLSDVNGDLRKLREELQAIEAEAAAKKLVIAPDGAVSWPPMQVAPGQPEVSKEAGDRYTAEQRSHAEEIGRRIADLLRRAGDADERGAAALRATRGKDATLFDSPDALGGGAEADAKRAADLFTRLSSLDSGDLDLLRNIMQANSGNPNFAEALTRSMKPTGLYDATGLIAQMNARIAAGDKNDPRLADLRQLQTDLGNSLAAASPRLVKDPAWMASMTEAGRKLVRVGDGDAYPGRATVYGYQLLGTLLGHGTYDTAFLRQTADEVIAFEKAAGKPSIWSTTLIPPPRFGLDLSRPGSGYDPVTGVLTAMSWNPEAAKGFFGDGGPARLDYLFKGRSPISDHIGGGGEPTSFDALGNALQAATTGRIPTGAVGLPDSPIAPHDDVMRRIAADTVNYIGGRGGLHGAVPGSMSDSMANMLAEYVDETHLSLSGDRLHNSLFGNTNDLVRAMKGTSGNPEAFRLLYDQELNYGATRIATAADPEAVKVEVNAGSRALGALDEIRAQVIMDYGSDSDTAKSWDSKYLYHTYGGGANAVAGVFLPPQLAFLGDFAQRRVNLITDHWYADRSSEIAEQTSINLEAMRKENADRLSAALKAFAESSPERGAPDFDVKLQGLLGNSQLYYGNGSHMVQQVFDK